MIYLSAGRMLDNRVVYHILTADKLDDKLTSMRVLESESDLYKQGTELYVHNASLIPLDLGDTKENFLKKARELYPEEFI